MHTRREFFNHFAIALPCAVMVLPLEKGGEFMWDQMRAPHDPIGKLEKAFGPDQADRLRLIDRLFTDRGSAVSLVPGSSHYAYPGSVHPDDQWAADKLFQTARLMSKDFVVDPHPASTTADRSFVCMGSPVSNALTRHILEYSHIDSAHPELGLVRDDAPLFKLPFEFELDGSSIKRGANQAMHQSDPDRQVPNWSIKTSSHTLVPHVGDGDGSDDVDYLLITRLPSFSKEGPQILDDKNTVTIFSGTHGVGTAAVGLLFEREDLLKKIVRVSERHNFWQVLITVNGMKKERHPVSGTMRPVATSLSPDIESEAVEIS